MVPDAALCNKLDVPAPALFNKPTASDSVFVITLPVVLIRLFATPPAVPLCAMPLFEIDTEVPAGEEHAVGLPFLSSTMFPEASITDVPLQVNVPDPPWPPQFEHTVPTDPAHPGQDGHTGGTICVFKM